MSVDPRFTCGEGVEVFTGNELLVKGVLEVEGGVPLLTGYPGSPVASFFDILGDVKGLLQPAGVRAFQANNEALAAAAVNGSQMVGAKGLAVMKSVGVHVAADALALGTLAGAHPKAGAVIVMGDDPWCDSTQVPADSRFICQHLRMAVVEPGTAQQVKDWIDVCFKLSQAAGVYIGYIITTAQADGGGSVVCRPNQFPTLNTHQRLALDTAGIDLNKVLLPPRTWQQELAMPQRMALTMQKARELGVNRIFPATRFDHPQGVSPLGFVVTGMGGPYLAHVLADLGLSGVFPVLQMGMPYPADTELLAEFAGSCRQIIVIEERRSFLEQNLRDALFHRLPHEQAAEIASRMYGKAFPSGLPGIPDVRGLNPSLLASLIIPLIRAQEQLPLDLRNGRLTSELQRLREASKPRLSVLGEQRLNARTPTFCPGCPHRDSSSVLLEIRRDLADPAYMQRTHKRGPVDLVAHGDTGCYTMLMFAPTEQLMHNYSGMGLGAGTGSGIDPFITNKQIVFMGDGTFFHSGQIAISNAIKAGQDITFIILENGTTAMTGHQEHAGTELDVLGNRSFIQNIESIVRSMAGTSPLTVSKLSPADRPTYRKVLERAILRDGVKVVIADKECGITYHRRKLREERSTIRRYGYLPRKTHMNVTPEVCENCLECTRQTACPGLTSVETDYGRKIDTDLTWCVNDGACERVRVSNSYGNDLKPCPSFEEVTVIRNRRRRYNLPHMALDKLPEPAFRHSLSEAGEAWRVHLSGVGGMGIGVVTAILVRAGHKEGHRVVFSDKKGLAIRNGGVFAQITFLKPDGQSTPMDAPLAATHFTTGAIPFGKADLLLGIDVLEAARAVDPAEQFRIASPQRTSAVVNMHRQPTVYMLLGRDDFDPDQLREQIWQKCDAGHSYARDLSTLCEQKLGSKQYANLMMLGVAFQLGLIPVSMRSMAWAIKDSIRRDHRKNLKAFNIGRKLALEPTAIPRRPEPKTSEQLVTNKSRILRRTRWWGRLWADRYEQTAQLALRLMRDLDEELKYDLALRVYDILQYQNHKLARRYVDLVHRVYERDSAERGFQATRAVIWNLAKVMLIKDEPYVSYLLTRFEKQQRDIEKYSLDVTNGDRLVYRHHTSPEFHIGPWRIRLRLTTRNWQLRLMAGMRWLRNTPGWHSREAKFRDWYIGLIERVDFSTPQGYAVAVEALRCPDTVTGYREIRYPKQDEATLKVEALLSQPPSGPAASPGSTTTAGKAMAPTR